MAFNEETFFLGRADASEGLILVVDDEPDTRKVVRMTLAIQGYDIIEAEDGEKAIQKVREPEVNLRLGLVITDVRMPNMSGVELINYLQQHFPEKRIIVFTGFPDMEMATGWLKEGIVDYLVKPVEKEKLLGAVRRAFGQEDVEPNRSRLPKVTSVGSAPKEAGSNIWTRLSEKFSSWKTQQRANSLDRAVWAGIAHNIKSEMTHLASSNERLRIQASGNAELEEECRKLDASIEYVRIAVQRLFHYLGARSSQAETIMVSSVLTKVENLARDRMPSNISFSVQCEDAESACFIGSGDQLADVLIGVLENSKQALHEQSKGSLRVRVGHTMDTVLISVMDNGPGIPLSLLDKLFKQPVKSKRGGTGVGLYLYSRMINSMGGRMECESSPNGATVRIILPRHREKE